MAKYDVATSNNFLGWGSIGAGNSAACFAIDSAHVLLTYRGTDNDGFAQVFAVNTGTWEVTTAAAALEFDTQDNAYNALSKIDATHFINFWMGPAGDGFVQVLTVNLGTWAVTTAAASLEFDTRNGQRNTGYQVDTNHFINFWGGGAGITGLVQMFTVNTTTWAVTTSAASLTFDTLQISALKAFRVDTNHALLFWGGAGDEDGYIQIFTINTTTWAVTTAAAKLEIDTQGISSPNGFKIDDTHFILFWSGANSTVGKAQVISINTTTWAVATAGAVFDYAGAATQGNYNQTQQVDANHFINWFQATDSDGFAQVFEVNTTTWAVTTAAAALEFDTQNYITLLSVQGSYQMDPTHYILFWGNADVGSDRVQIFEVLLSNIKTINGLVKGSVKTVDALANASMKTFNGLE